MHQSEALTMEAWVLAGTQGVDFSSPTRLDTGSVGGKDQQKHTIGRQCIL